MDVKKLTAPCGLPCFACAVYKNNITLELTQQIASQFKIQPEAIPCSGCRSKDGCSFEKFMSPEQGCKTKQCVLEQGLHNCSECTSFPCENLMPIADMADQVQNNTKVYHLARIKLLGLEAWSKEAALIQQKYFQGKFNYGQAPKLETTDVTDATDATE